MKRLSIVSIALVALVGSAVGLYAAESETFTGAAAASGKCTPGTVNGGDGILVDSITATTGSTPAAGPTPSAESADIVTSKVVTVNNRKYTVYEYTDPESKTYCVVIPEGLKTVRGLFVNSNYYAGDSRGDWTFCHYYREFMHLHDFALVAANGTCPHVTAFKGFRKSLQKIRVASKHPELVNAPYAAVGFSAGGGFASTLMTMEPEKTITAGIIGARYNFTRVTPPAPAALLGIPSVLITGEQEHLNDSQIPDDPNPHKVDDVFVPHRPKGGEYAWIEKQGIGHEYAENRQDLAIMPLMDFAVRARYPKDGDVTKGPIKLLSIDPATGWVADHTTWKSGFTKIVPAKEFKGDLGRSSWLQNEDIAFIYRAYATYDNPLTITAPGPCGPGTPAVDPGSNVPITVDASKFPKWKKLEFYDGAKKLGTVTAAPAQFTATNLTPGYHVFSVLGTDAQGTMRASNPVMVVVRKLAEKPARAERHGIVVAVSPPGADTGRDILQNGGNAVDAAVATAFALTVTHPTAGNIGGGGFMLIYPPGGKGAPVVIDYREKAPRAASKTMFTKEDTWYSAKAVGVPGTVRGLALAHARFGTLPWKDLVMPAVKLAEEGFVIDAPLAASLNGVVGSSPKSSELRRVFGKNGEATWKAGDRLVQKDLAKTLRLIAEKGPDGFYKGAVAELFAAQMKRDGGLITMEDLASYEAKERQPIHGTYRGYDVYGPPPPSSGGICLVEMLNILENFDLRKQDRFSPETLHILIETMRRAYCDRARYLGDTDFVTIPEFLTSKEHARKLAQVINRHKATRSEDLAKDIPLKGEGASTTHFSVLDGDGMAVTNTYTLGQSYGSRIVVKGAGFLLNNEMTDFNWFPGETTRRGGIGTEPNQLAPGKRMLSSQTPTIVAKDGKIILITGSPGDRTIINTVLCLIVNVIDFEMDLQAAVDAPRLHHPWFPDTVFFEGVRTYAESVKRLQTMGHSVRSTRQGDAHSIGLDRKTGKYIGAADHRIAGKVSGF